MNPEHEQSPRWLKWAQLLWIVVIFITLVLFAIGAVLYYQNLKIVHDLPAKQLQHSYANSDGVEQLAARGLSLETYALLRMGYRVLYALIPIILGLLVFARRRDEPIALLVSFFLITFSISGEPLSVLGDTYPGLLWFTTLIEFAGLISLPLFFGLFPNGRMVPRAYWLVVFLSCGTYLISDVLGVDVVNDPIWLVLSYIAWLSVLLGGVAAQIYRYPRISTAKEKRQTRWVLYGMAIMTIFFVGTLVFIAIRGDAGQGITDDQDLAQSFFSLVISNLGFEFIFIGMGMAILRSSLFDIDVIIRKTVLYAALTALLGLVYFGIVVFLQELFGRIGGQANSPLAIVISTLAIAALFNPLSARLQNFIDRRFFRQKYNAEQALESFSRSARDEVEIEQLTIGLVSTVQETMQPEQVSLWLSK